MSDCANSQSVNQTALEISKKVRNSVEAELLVSKCLQQNRFVEQISFEPETMDITACTVVQAVV